MQFIAGDQQLKKWVIGLATVGLLLMTGCGHQQGKQTGAAASRSRQVAASERARSKVRRAASSQSARRAATSKASAASAAAAASRAKQAALPASLTAELTKTVSDLTGTYSIYLSDPQTGATWSYHNQAQRSASVIKLFIMGYAFKEALAGQFDMNATYTLRAQDIVGGTGSLQGMAVGTRLTNSQLITKMIQVSDNTATNVLITRLGGFAPINAYAKSVGATATTLARKMLDTSALARGVDNQTSAHDLGVFLTKLAENKLAGAKADTQMLGILAGQTNRTKLPAQVPSGVTTYNKTGEYDSPYGVENDAAIFKAGSHSRIIVVLSQGGVLTQQVSAMNQIGRLVGRSLLTAH